MNELARDLFSISYHCPRSLAETEERLSKLVRENPAMRRFALHKLLQASELFPEPQVNVLRVLAREASDDPEVCFFLRWYGYFACSGEDGMSSEAVLRVLAKEAPQFRFFREYMAQNAGTRVLLNFESHPEMWKDLGDYVGSYPLENYRVFPELLPTALAIIIARERESWSRPKPIPELEDLQDEYELTEFRKLKCEDAESSPRARSRTKVPVGEFACRDGAVEFIRGTREGIEREDVVGQVALHYSESGWIRELLRELILEWEGRTAAVALDSLLAIGDKLEARDLAIYISKNRTKDYYLLSSALRVLVGDQTDAAIAELTRLALDPFLFGSEDAIHALARNRHNHQAVKKLIYHRARLHGQERQSGTALVALFWYYGEEREALRIFEETAAESNHPELTGLAFTILDCLRCSGVVSANPLPVNRNDWPWRKDTAWLDSIALSESLERVYSHAIKALRGDVQDPSDFETGTAAFRLAMFFSNRSGVFERLFFVAASHGREYVRKDALRALFCRWPDHPEVHALLKETATRTDRDEQSLAIRMLSLAYPEDPETLPLLEQIASRHTFDDASSAAFSEYIRLRGCTPDVLEWAITVLGTSKGNYLEGEGPWHLFRCFGPRKSLLAALRDLARSTTDLDLLNSITAVLAYWAPTAVANSVPSRIADADDEETQLKLVEGPGSSEEHRLLRLKLCANSPYVSVRLRALSSLLSRSSISGEVLSLALRLIADAPLEAAKIGERIPFPEHKETIAAKLVESHRRLAMKENRSYGETWAMSHITGTLRRYYAETSAALEHFRAVVQKTPIDPEYHECLMGLQRFYDKDPEVRALIDHALPSGRLDNPVGLLTQIASAFDNPSAYFESITRGDLPLPVRIAAIRALSQQGEPGIEVLMKLIDTGPPELKKESLGNLRYYALNAGRLHTEVHRFLAKHGY